MSIENLELVGMPPVTPVAETVALVGANPSAEVQHNNETDYLLGILVVTGAFIAFGRAFVGSPEPILKDRVHK